MKRKYKLFDSIRRLDELIDQYFVYIKGDYEPVGEQVKSGKNKDKPLTEKICIREPEPPTLAGLILYLGFNSKEEFEMCAAAGRYSDSLSRAQLRIAAALEQKLQKNSVGTIHVLKSMGHNYYPDKKEKRTDHNTNGVLKVEVTQSGPNPAADEKEVVLE
jgi:hypothetical protein